MIIETRAKKAPKKLLKGEARPEPSIFDQIRNDPKYTQARSIEWFRRKIDELGANTPTYRSDLFKSNKERQTGRMLPGAMYFFSYDPKHRETLPYYDKFPLILCFGLTEDGMMGINFHYLPYIIRVRLLDKLLLIANKYHDNQQRVLRFNWEFLSNAAKFPEIKPAVKRYLYSHVTTRFLKVDVQDWKTAVLLPTESFAKKSYAYVARASGQIIKRNM